jgi:hypothetical protein
MRRPRRPPGLRHPGDCDGDFDCEKRPCNQRYPHAPVLGFCIFFPFSDCSKKTPQQHYHKPFRYYSPNHHHHSAKYQIAIHRRLHRPTDNFARIKIQHNSQIKPALPGAYVGYVSHPCHIRLRNTELSVQCVRGNQGGSTFDCPRLFLGAQRFDRGVAHNVCNTVSSAALSGFPKVQENSWGTIHTSAGVAELPYQAKQTLVLNCPVPKQLVKPLVVTRSGDAQQSAHRLYTVLNAMLKNEAVLYSNSLAAFFRMSRSSSVMRSCDFSVRISVFAASRSAACWVVLSGLTALTHL